MYPRPTHIYPPEAYDRYLALKPPVLLLVVMAYCVLPLAFVLLAYNPSPKLRPMFEYLQHYASPLALLCGLPAALVWAALIKRLPAGGALWRGIWARGRVLLSLSLAGHFALLAVQRGGHLLGAYFLSDADRWVVVSLGVDALALYYLWRVARVGDVFADFPAPPVAEASEAASVKPPA